MGGKGAVVVVYCGGAKKSSVASEAQGVSQGGFFGTLLLGAVRPSEGAEVFYTKRFNRGSGCAMGDDVGMTK